MEQILELLKQYMPAIVTGASASLIAICRNVPGKIIKWIKRRIQKTITISSFEFREKYMCLNNYISQIDHPIINNNIRINYSYLSRDTNYSKTLNLGTYNLYLGHFTWMTISKKLFTELNTGAEGAPEDISVSILGLDRDKIINEILLEIDKKNILRKNELEVMSFNEFNGLNSFFTNKRSFDTVFSPYKKTILNFIDNWINSEKTYQKYQITYKTGILLYGIPGTGKSTIAKCIASYTNKSLIVINLSCKNAIQQLESLRHHGKNKVILFEEIDILTSNRDNKDEQNTEKEKILSTLLTILDGVTSPSNSIFVATTNHYEKLDSALTRIGRFDLALNLDNLDYSTANEMCEFYNQDINDFWNYDSHNINPSKLQNKLLQNLKDTIYAKGI